MTFETIDFTSHIGTEVRADLDLPLEGSIAKYLRALLERRGVLLFRGHDMTAEQHLRFAKTLDTPHNEHGTDITKVSADRNESPIFAEYTKGTYFFHFDDTYIGTRRSHRCCWRAWSRRKAGRPSSTTPMPSTTTSGRLCRQELPFLQR